MGMLSLLRASEAHIVFPLPFGMDGEARTLTLTLYRHGESEANLRDIFGGFLDVPLSENGEKIAKDTDPYPATIIYTSALQRSINTACLLYDLPPIACNSAPRFEQHVKNGVKLIADWRLNERCYGALQGLSKKDVKRVYPDLIEIWRRSLDIRPPRALPLSKVDKVDFPVFRSPVYEANFGESQMDVMKRIEELWDQDIKLLRGSVAIIGHGTSLRTLLMVILSSTLNKEEIPTCLETLAHLEIPNLTPIRVAIEFRENGEVKRVTQRIWKSP